MASYDYDVIVIGSGAGGSIVASQVAKSGKSVALIEADKLGGQVLHYSAVPTKALLQSAEMYEVSKRGVKYGIRSNSVSYNYPTVRAWKEKVCKKVNAVYDHEYYTTKGISVIGGRAYFIDPHTVSVGTARFTAAKFVIATGSELLLPEISGLSSAGFLTHKEVVNISRPPKSALIIGGGASGLEFAQLLAIFGSKVTLVEATPQLLGEEEPEISEFLKKRLQKEYSIEVITETQVQSVRKVGLKREVTALRKGKTGSIIVDEIILTSGKSAVVDIGLENAGVRYDEGEIYTDRFQRSSAKHIYAVGDCSGPYPYTHTAAYQGQIVAHNIVHPKNLTAAQYHAVPRTIFTTPPVAATGLTEKQLRARGADYVSLTMPVSNIAKSATSGQSDGFIKLLASKQTKALLGATLVCPNADELIQELTLAVQYNLTAQQLAHTIHAFGTWSEIIRVACAKLDKS